MTMTMTMTMTWTIVKRPVGEYLPGRWGEPQQDECTLDRRFVRSRPPGGGGHGDGGGGGHGGGGGGPHGGGDGGGGGNDGVDE